MDRKQKERLRVLMKARKRADKVLAYRRETERTQQERNQRLETNQALMQQYTEDLTALARESGILALAEQAAQQRGGRLTQELSCYVYYGLSGSSFQNALGITDRGELRASHLALHITWEADGAPQEVEVRVHKHGPITFQHFFLPILPFLWRSNPQLLPNLLARALKHPKPPATPLKKTT